jgi:hypothetical protein
MEMKRNKAVIVIRNGKIIADCKVLVKLGVNLSKYCPMYEKEKENACKGCYCG